MEKSWEYFMKTGLVDAYLSYRQAAAPANAAGSAEPFSCREYPTAGITALGASGETIHGERNGDGDGAFSHAHRGI